MVPLPNVLGKYLRAAPTEHMRSVYVRCSSCVRPEMEARGEMESWIKAGRRRS